MGTHGLEVGGGAVIGEEEDAFLFLFVNRDFGDPRLPVRGPGTARVRGNMLESGYAGPAREP